MNRLFFLLYGYKLGDETKDVGQIPLGLSRIGYDASIITLDKPSLKDYTSSIPLIKIKSRTEISDLVKKDDVALFYSDAPIEDIRLLKSIDAKIVWILDSDGRLGRVGEPKPRFYFLRSLRKPIWKIPFRFLNVVTPLGSIYERQEIQKLELVDKVVIKSFPALANLAFFVYQHKKNEIIKKISMIPDPVTDDILDTDFSHKENIVISIGRWDDWLQKNPKDLIKAISKFLQVKKDWKSFILGNGTDVIKKYVERFATKEVKERIDIIGPVPHDKVKEYLSKSKILFMPSRFESFGIAAGEALCCGCSVVSTQIEPLSYMTLGGFTGLTSNFDYKNLASSLLLESELWDKGIRKLDKIASFWRENLSLKEISSQFEDIIKTLSILKGGK